MLLNLTIALGAVVAELLILAIAGIFAYTRLKASKNRIECENSFSEVEREDLIALSQELGRTNREIFENLEKLDETARLHFSPGMGALRHGYQDALESMKMGASSLLGEPPNIPMACQAILEANQALMKAMSEATRDLAGLGEPVEGEEEAEAKTGKEQTPAAPGQEEAPADSETKEEVMV